MAVSRRDFLKLTADGTGTANPGVIGAEMSLGRSWRELTDLRVKDAKTTPSICPPIVWWDARLWCVPLVGKSLELTSNHQKLFAPND